MKIGIISDTHDNLPKIREAVRIFNEQKVDLVIHAGDFIAPFAINPLSELRCEYIGVFGNNDGEKFGLTKISQGRITPAPRPVELGDRKVLILHEPNEIDALSKSQVYDMIIYGHTHKPVNEKHGKTLVINPGECGGWLTGKSTIALADLDWKTGEVVELS